MADQLLTRLKPFDIVAFMTAQANDGTMTLSTAISTLQGDTLTYACPQCANGANNANTGVIPVPQLNSVSVVCPTCRGMLKTDIPYFAVNGQYIALAITGPVTVVVNATVTLNASVAGGAWSSGTQGVATINANTGVVTGVSAGTTVITYTLNQKAVTLNVTVTAQ